MQTRGSGAWGAKPRWSRPRKGRSYFTLSQLHIRHYLLPEMASALFFFQLPGTASKVRGQCSACKRRVVVQHHVEPKSNPGSIVAHKKIGLEPCKLFVISSSVIILHFFILLSGRGILNGSPRLQLLHTPCLTSITVLEL